MTLTGKSRVAQEGATPLSYHHSEGSIGRHSWRFTVAGMLKIDAVELPTVQLTGQEVLTHEFN